MRNSGFRRRIKALFLAITIVVSTFYGVPYVQKPVIAQAASGVQDKMNALRGKFPEGRFWNHVVSANNNGDQLMQRGDESFADTTTGSPCRTHAGTAGIGQIDCNYFDGGIQCMGFAKKVFYDIYGQRESQLPARYDVANVMVGDYVRIRNNTHSGVVLSRNGNNIRLLECNLSGGTLYPDKNCKIGWGGINYSIYEITYFKHATNYDQINNVNADNGPVGDVDHITSAPGQISLDGWAFDRDCTSKTLSIHVYIDGVFVGQGVANTSRPDLDNVYGVGGNHGFNFTLKTDMSGEHEVAVWAINVDRNGNDVGEHNVTIGRKRVNIIPEIQYTVNTENVLSVGNKKATVKSSLTPAGNANSWGFYIGTDDRNMNKYTVSASSTSSDKMSLEISNYYTLKPGTTYYYKTWAWVNNKEKIGAVRSFTTTAVKPDVPKLNITSDSKDIGIGDAPSFYWNDVDNADYYKMYLYNEQNELVQESDVITGKKYAFGAVDKEGQYTAYIEAYNEIGSKGKSEGVTFNVHPDVTVKFVDADSFVDAGEGYVPEVLNEQKVHYGKAANKPADPEHKGYTFSKWEGNYSSVKEDTVIKAVYNINKYKVKFVDSVTNKELGTETVEYYSSANPPEYDVETGYAKTGYDGWDKDYKCITEDCTLYTCVGWYNDNFPIYASIVSAKREYDAEESDNEGYTVVASLKNWDESTTKGRIVAALKTQEGKLLTTTESSAFSIKKSTTKQLEIFVPYGEAASIAEIYVIGQYKDAVPITTTASNNATKKIDQSDTYTNWSTDKPAEDAKNQESRTEYRYQDKKTITSYNTSMSGYVQSGSTWVKTGSGAIDYVSSFPAGFDRGNGYYAAYNKTPLTAFENSTDKRTVSTSVAGYLYWHWCRGNYTSGPINRRVSDCYETSYPTFHAFTSGALGYNGSAGAFQCSNPAVCRDTYWWLTQGCYNGNQLPIYKCSYTDYKKQFTYYKWTDFTDWNTTAVTESNDRKVETRTVYRYQPDSMLVEDTSGEERTVKGRLGKEFAGKEAALFIYKVDEASDYTNEFVAQTVLNDNGDYEFKFKLREEPTAETGDFTIVLGVEGTSSAIYLDKIEAPKPEYTVNFYDYNGNVISTEKVKEGDAATLPDEEKLDRTGYTFTKWSDTNTNITEDKDIYAEYKINEYNVVFVDWKANTVQVKKFEYGAQLVAPQAEEPEEGSIVEWDAIADGNLTVTSDMVVCTRYSKKSYTVTIMDFDNKVISADTVQYGQAMNLPDIAEGTDKIFLGWQDISDGEEAGISETLVTKNMIVCPVFVYKNTVEKPKADVKSGTYAKKQTVTLSSDTKDADIYYTLDGSNPKGSSGILYTKPIVVDDAVELRFYACKAGMNDSETARELYCVNYDGAMSKWMVKDELPDYVKNNMSEYDVYTETGYRYKDTKKVTKADEVSRLEADGWVLDENAAEEYTDYTEWADELSNDADIYASVDIDTKAVYKDASQYKYSHYKYEDGTTTQYSADKVADVECIFEETQVFDKPLSIAGFEEDDTPYYVYDGQKWYNQTKINGKVQTGNQYRWRGKVLTYYKWTDYSTDTPDSQESRETEKQTVYSFVRHNTYIVTIHSDANTDNPTYSYLAEEGKKVEAANYYVVPGYDVEGIYTDKNYKTKWDVDNDTIKSDTELYVKYEKKKYTIIFEDENGNELSTQEVVYGESAKEPEAPAKDGYKFVGWDNDSWKNVQYDLSLRPKYISNADYATVKLDNTSLNLYVGKTAELTAVITPSSKAGTDLTWTSSDESIVSVSSEGKVTAIGKGKAVITVTVNETGESATCSINVNENTDGALTLSEYTDLSVDEFGYLRGLTVSNNRVKNVKNQFKNSNLVVKDASGKELSNEDLVGTGAKIYLMSGSRELDEMEIVVVGDVTGDGVLNNRDVSMVSRALIDKEVPTDCQILAADVNGDGYVNNRDVAMISRCIVGKETI